MPEIIFHPDVEQEVFDSYKWYQEQAEGLGNDFITELEAAYQAIVEFPETWPKFGKHCRRFLLGKFPFSVVYKESKDSIFVLSVMHNSREPGYWESRRE